METESVIRVISSVDANCDWRALECVTPNDLYEENRLLREVPSSKEFRTPLIELQAEVIIGDGRQKQIEVTVGKGGTTRTIGDLLHAFIHSTTLIILLQYTFHALRLNDWTNGIPPTSDAIAVLSGLRCCWQRE